MQITIHVGAGAPAAASAADRVIAVELPASRPDAVLALARALEDGPGLEDVTAVRCTGSASLTGMMLDAWQVVGGDVTAVSWIHGGGDGYDPQAALLGLPVDPALRWAARDFIAQPVPTVRVDVPGWPRSALCFVAGFGAASSLLGERPDGVSLVGLLRGAGQALGALGDDPVPTAVALISGGEVLVREARLVVGTGLGLPPAVARWAGSVVAAPDGPRVWYADVDLGNLMTMLRGGPLRSVALGQLTASGVTALSLDGLVCEVASQPVRISAGPVVDVLVPPSARS